MHIYLVNKSSVVADGELASWEPAFQHYADLVCNAWNVKRPTLAISKTPPTESWQLVFFDDSDQQGALGYHDFTPGGKPIAKVFARTDLKYGYSIPVTATHELGEMICDPWICEAMETDTRFWALEVGDPVEADKLGFTYKTPAGVSVLLSDFALPAWFMPGSPGPFDHGNHCKAPLEVLADGYAQYFEAGKWNQVGPNGRREPMDADDLRLRTRFRPRPTS